MSDTSVADHLLCNLSYDGSSKDVAINYTLLVLNVLVAATSLLSPKTPENFQRRRHALILFVSVIFFQIILCLQEYCVGISLVWCSIMGWIWMDRRREMKGMEEMKLACMFYQADIDIPNALLLDHENMVLGIDMLGIFYYAMVSEPMITMTHILAIVAFGIPSYFAMETFFPDEGTRTLKITGRMKDTARQHSHRFLVANLSL